MSNCQQGGGRGGFKWNGYKLYFIRNKGGQIIEYKLFLFLTIKEFWKNNRS
jgi:hypothetical protein